MGNIIATIVGWLLWTWAVVFAIDRQYATPTVPPPQIGGSPVCGLHEPGDGVAGRTGFLTIQHHLSGYGKTFVCTPQPIKIYILSTPYGFCVNTI
jgi:hypothetical protein